MPSNPELLELVSSHVFLFELITMMSDHYCRTIAVSLWTATTAVGASARDEHSALQGEKSLA